MVNNAGCLENGPKRGKRLIKAASSLRPHIVQVMAAHQGRVLATEEIYGLVAELGVAGFNPNAKRDRNLVNRELSDLAGHTTQGHSKPSPQIIMRVSRGRYLYREPTRPMDAALLQEYLEPVEVYEKRPARRRGDGNRRPNVPESVRMGLYAVQRGVCPGCGFHQPHHLRFEIDHIVALSDDGEHETRNLQLLCGVLQSGEGDAGEPRVPDEDGRAAGPQRGDGCDGGRTGGGVDRPEAGAVPLGEWG